MGNFDEAAFQQQIQSEQIQSMNYFYFLSLSGEFKNQKS